MNDIKGFAEELGYEDPKEEAEEKENSIEESNSSQDFYYETKHLPYFDLLSDITLLEGDEYRPIIKGVYYHILGRLATNYIKEVNVGGLKTDLRVHLTIPLSSGQGKKNIKTAIKTVFDSLKFKGHVPTSSHPEQFIGKVINRGNIKKPVWIKNEGYLSRDFIMIDEAYNLLMSKDQNIEETRKNFRIAKDRIGENLVEKKSVDNTFNEDERLAYCPEVVSVQFLQPKHLPSNIVEEGDFRRDLILYVKGISARDKSIDYENRIRKIDYSRESLKEFCSFAKDNLGRLNGNRIEFEDEAIDKVIELHRCLVKHGLSHSEKGANFSKMVDFTLQDFLVKLSSLIGIAHGVYIITPEIVELAYMDLLEFFDMQLNFVNEKVKGKLDYGDGWNGALNKDQECLEWLYNKSKDNPETALNEFKLQIAKIRGCGEDMAQKHYQRYEKSGWIEIEHVFQKYFVRLAFTPKYINSGLMLYDGKDSNPGNAYENIVSKIEDIMDGLPTLPGLPPCEKISIEGGKNGS